MSKNKMPNPWYIGVVSGMASYIDSAAIVSNGTALVIYQKTLGITALEIGMLSGLLTLSIAAGAFGGGRLGDRLELVVEQAGPRRGGTQAAHAERGVLLVGRREEEQRLVGSRVERPQDDLAPRKAAQHATVLLHLLLDARWRLASEEAELRAEQPDALDGGDA